MGVVVSSHTHVRTGAEIVDQPRRHQPFARPVAPCRRRPRRRPGRTRPPRRGRRFVRCPRASATRARPGAGPGGTTRGRRGASPRGAAVRRRGPRRRRACTPGPGRGARCDHRAPPQSGCEPHAGEPAVGTQGLDPHLVLARSDCGKEPPGAPAALGEQQRLPRRRRAPPSTGRSAPTRRRAPERGRSTPVRFSATRVPGSDGRRLSVRGLDPADAYRVARATDLEHVADRDRATDQRAGDDGSDATRREHAIDPQSRSAVIRGAAPLGAGPCRARRERCPSPPTGDGVARHDRHVAATTTVRDRSLDLEHRVQLAVSTTSRLVSDDQAVVHTEQRRGSRGALRSAASSPRVPRRRRARRRRHRRPRACS